MVQPKTSGVLLHPFVYIIGSGGHTTEMAKILTALLRHSEPFRERFRNHPNRFLIANTDITSEVRFEKSLAMAGFSESLKKEGAIVRVPRSREVLQNWFTTIWTALYSFLWSLWFVYQQRPGLILCNGPGTCVPFCVATYIWRLLGILDRSTKLVYIESFCRVQSLSLSGKMLLPLMDMFVVQWEPLAAKYGHKPHVYYFGNIL